MDDKNFLSEAAKVARREYRRKWNKQNKDKVRAAQNRYWEKKARMRGGEAENEHAETNDKQASGESSVPDDRAGV